MTSSKSITFTHDMAEAIHEGRKTETRRLCDVQPPKLDIPGALCVTGYNESDAKYQVGDVLLVKEPCWIHPESGSAVYSEESTESEDSFLVLEGFFCLADEMPEWAVRTRIKITGVELQWFLPNWETTQAEGFKGANDFMDAMNKFYPQHDWHKERPLVWVYRFEVVQPEQAGEKI